MIVRTADEFLPALSARAAAARLPEGATFELTYGCNLRCLHCYNPTHRALPQELTTAEVCSILDQVADVGVLTVTFTGGEPTLRADIAPILRHAHRRGLLLQLLTNATRLTPRFCDLLEEVRMSQVNLSMYGATKETYARMTGVPEAFRQFLQGLERLADRRIPVTVRMPVTTVNRGDIDACRSLVESLGLRFQYGLDVMPRTDGDPTPLAYRLSPAEKTRIDGQQLGAGLSAWIPEPCGTDRPFLACACGRSRFAVTPYGEMNLCVAFPIPRYDLRQGTVREGWRILTDTVDALRPNQHDHCPPCELNRFCRQGRADAWLETGDPNRCLPHFKEWATGLREMHALLDPRQPR